MSTKYSHRLSIKACFSPTGHYWWNTRDLLGVSMIFLLLTLEPIDRCYASVCVSAYRTEEKQLIKIIHRNLGFKKTIAIFVLFRHSLSCLLDWLTQFIIPVLYLVFKVFERTMRFMQHLFEIYAIFVFPVFFPHTCLCVTLVRSADSENRARKGYI